MAASSNRGFTLIELSVVLVIIGLIAGGILVGQDLIAAATIRSQVAQFDKYQLAVTTFRTKYNALPGDMSAQIAAATGFIARGQYAGEGDGNGIMEGISADAAGMNKGTHVGAGENAVLWVDLSQANLIDGKFNTANSTVPPSGNILVSGSTPLVRDYLPIAKLGQGLYISTYSDSGVNYFAISKPDPNGGGIVAGYALYSLSGMPVKQAYQIDQKIDDGMPQSGHVLAMFNDGDNTPPLTWAAGGPLNSRGADPGTAAPVTDLSCYDNGNVAGVVMHYSTARNNGNGTNCALSIRFN